MFDELSFGKLAEFFDSIKELKISFFVSEGSASPSRQSSTNSSLVVLSKLTLGDTDSVDELLI